MPRAFVKPKVVHTSEDKRKAEAVIKAAGGHIDGLITRPAKSSVTEEVKKAVDLLLSFFNYEIRVTQRVGTHKTTWKRFERTVAHFFGHRRVPLSGSNSGHNTNSDSLHPLVYIESKYRKGAFGIFDLFLDTEAKAMRENKIPVVALKQKNVDGFLLVIRPEDFSLLNQLKELSSDVENLEGLEIVITKSNNGRRITKEIRRKVINGKV